MRSSFSHEVWSIDTEWGFLPGHVDEESAWQPVVLCAVGLHTRRRLHFWERDERLARFFADHSGDVFAAHYAVAEMKFLLRLGVPIPQTWFDTFVAWRHKNNALGRLEAGLSYALHALGLPHLAPTVKKELQTKILNLDFDADDPSEQQKIIDYCFSDCDGCLALYNQLNTPIVQGKMAHWTPYLKAVARMELRGIPFDGTTYGIVQKQKGLIRASVTNNLNRTFPIYQEGKFRKDQILKWCASAAIRWPTKRSDGGKACYHSMEKETFKEMEGRHPFIGKVREVRKTLNSFTQQSLTVDRNLMRHFFETNVFRSVTSRNQPKNFVFNGPKWLRYLIVPESPDHVLVYVDYTAQEIGIAAALSNDQHMRETYESEDCHMAFAIRAGAAPHDATKTSHPVIRKRYKAVNLGVQYGQTEFGICRKLGIPLGEAKALLSEHRSLFSTFWDWSEDLVQGSYDRGWIVTPCGWPSRVSPSSNERSWMNWPMQTTGSDIMRLTVTYLDQQNVQILAPVHDGFLLTCRRHELDDLNAAVETACKTAIDQVIPGFPLRWDTEVHEVRFEDEDGLPIWNLIQDELAAIDEP